MKTTELHQKAFVLDSHCDTPLMLMEGLDLGKRQDIGHFDYIRMKEGGVDAIFFVLYTSNALSDDESTRKALQLLARIYDSVDASHDKVRLAFSVDQALENKSQGLGSIFIGMENGAPIQTDLSLLRLFYRMGVRYMTLTHAGNNHICDSCATEVKKWSGVSPFGIEVIAEMNRLGMIIDCSHISDEAFYDVLKYSEAPVVATHSCCRALASHPRNMTDQMIKDLAAKGGVIQINFYPAFLDDDYARAFFPLDDAYENSAEKLKGDPENVEFQKEFETAKEAVYSLKRPSYKRVVDHIDHVVELVGVKHVGLGSDFDGITIGPEGLEDIGKMEVITNELITRGYSEDDIIDIMGGNFLRVMKEVESLAK